MSARVASHSTVPLSAHVFKNPSLPWMIGFLFVVSFLGLFAVVPLRKIMIIDFKLTYPSGTATAHLINGFHTPGGAKLTKKQVKALGKFFSFSFLWGFFQWFYKAEDGCGFAKFPSLGLKAFQNRCISLTNFHFTLCDYFCVCLMMTNDGQLFLKDQIPTWFAVAGYVTIAAISTATLPHIFPQLKWYYILVIYLFAPTLGFCNAYGCGLTDWSLASTYGKLAIFVIGAWAGASHGGILAGLAACGVVVNIVSIASNLIQDFKTGYLTLASPRSMFVSQVIGTAMGCVISPCIFWLFYKAFKDLGHLGSEYPVPYGTVYRSMAELGVEGFSSLPKHCLTLCYGFFAAAMIINGFRDLVGKKWACFIPLPMAMAIPFYIGPYFAIDMCVGSLILFIWEKTNKAKADAFGPAVASGLICGDGIWTLASSILAVVGVNPPICMKFLSRATNKTVDAFLGS
ncbi:hypothetical protein EUGRSUZ_K02320 [Eucalyptus grandis]|uniref:Uncharacterized protein n=2 Tax=Eucalyptus grandis TaxID=71139 RepID=A0ACC3IW08_EUCGR|nr:hypothetical protein EUGRSUZ_K02320 [Eucalyptus grandis]